MRWSVVHFTSDDKDSDMKDKTCRAGSCSGPVKVHSYWWRLLQQKKKRSVLWPFALSSSVIVLFVSALSSMEINRRHELQSDMFSCLYVKTENTLLWKLSGNYIICPSGPALSQNTLKETVSNQKDSRFKMTWYRNEIKNQTKVL